MKKYQNTPGNDMNYPFLTYSIYLVDNIAHTKHIESILHYKSGKNHLSIYRLSHLRYYLIKAVSFI